MTTSLLKQQFGARFAAFDALYFCDGACSKNPGPGGWGFLVYLAGPDRVEEGGGAAAGLTTNNRMELQAMLESARHFRQLGDQANGLVLLDSEYVRKGLSEWLRGWKAKDWIKSDGQPVANRDLWEELDAVFPKFKGRLKMKWVPGHEGIGGNERVDEIGVGFSKGAPPELYRGPASAYHPPIFDGLDRLDLEVVKSTKPKSKAAGGVKLAKPIYLSVLQGQLERHATWAECEARVKGKSGAKFKKVSTREEEAATLASWKNVIRD